MLSHIGSRKRLIYQLPVLGLFEIPRGGDIQVSIKEFDLLEGLVKSLGVLLNCLPFEVLSILHLGVECLFEFSRLSGIEILVFLKHVPQGGNFVLKYLLLSLPLLLFGRVLLLGLFGFFLQGADLPNISLSQHHELLLQFKNGFLIITLFKLQMVRYCASTQTRCLHPLEHSGDLGSFKHVKVII